MVTSNVNKHSVTYFSNANNNLIEPGTNIIFFSVRIPYMRFSTTSSGSRVGPKLKQRQGSETRQLTEAKFGVEQVNSAFGGKVVLEP